MKERIKDLCVELSNSHDPDRVRDISSELQLAIHEHIENIRKRLLAIPAATPFQRLSFDGLRGLAPLKLDPTADRENTPAASQVDGYRTGVGPITGRSVPDPTTT